MAGSPKKRAKREAAARAEVAAETAKNNPCTVAPEPGPPPVQSLVPVVEGELLIPPSPGAEPTRTALKRAMRARAQEHAEEAIAVLVENMRNKSLAPEKRESAAHKLLEWGFGKPAQEIEAGDGAQLIVIRRFGDQNEHSQ
jgi:hypothetical protein